METTDKKLAFALSGGGARGALQVGAMYALLEAGLKPDMLIGASIGAANASFLALHGFSTDTLDRLAASWRSAHASEMLPANYIWLTVRAMFGRSSQDPSRHLRDFLISQGLTPELCFADINQAQLVIVSSDLNTGKPILHGESPQDKVLDALLLSTALPPWFMPVQKQESYLMDGGLVSNLPIEPAIKLGATQIIALDLIDSRDTLGATDGVRHFIDRLIFSVEKRHLDLEMQLAEARRVPILYLGLTGESPVPIWDFQHSADLIARGYQVARGVIEEQRLIHPILAGLDG
jgi:NTE family protein